MSHPLKATAENRKRNHEKTACTAAAPNRYERLCAEPLRVGGHQEGGVCPRWRQVPMLRHWGQLGVRPHHAFLVRRRQRPQQHPTAVQNLQSQQEQQLHLQGTPQGGGHQLLRQGVVRHIHAARFHRPAVLRNHQEGRTLQEQDDQCQRSLSSSLDH